MSVSNGNGAKKQLRFANLIRVSTEKQKKKGESLRVQMDSNTQDVEHLGGTIVETYGGQEHATPGWEKAEIDRLLADAAKGKFDALIVSRNDRWSRDNDKNKEGLDVFRRHKVHFYISLMEMDLRDPFHCAILEMNAVFGNLNTALSNLYSLRSKIQRAKDGKPSCGSLPYGRTWLKDRDDLPADRRWGIDPVKGPLIRELADRFLKGEPLRKLVLECKARGGRLSDRAHLNRVLRDQCGPEWVQTFKSDRFGIDEAIPTTVPPLLDPETIQKIRDKLVRNRSYEHTPANREHDYLLSGKVFCAACGYSMLGHTDKRWSNSYYVHTKRQECQRPCPLCAELGCKPPIRADHLEMLVVMDLFNMLGNQAMLERAIKAAVPDCDKLQKRRAQLEKNRAKIAKDRKRVLDWVEEGVLTEAQAKDKLKEYQAGERDIEADLGKLEVALAEIPAADDVKLIIESIPARGVSPVTGEPLPDRIEVRDEQGNWRPGGNDVATLLAMSEADKRQLICSVFEGRVAGKPAGVHVTVLPKQKGRRDRPYTYRLAGRLQFGSLLLSWSKEQVAGPGRIVQLPFAGPSKRAQAQPRTKDGTSHQARVRQSSPTTSPGRKPSEVAGLRTGPPPGRPGFDTGRTRRGRPTSGSPRPCRPGQNPV
jgi:DNA invertase Pin-like site-specific DNA recombinase